MYGNFNLRQKIQVLVETLTFYLNFHRNLQDFYENLNLNLKVTLQYSIFYQNLQDSIEKIWIRIRTSIPSTKPTRFSISYRHSNHFPRLYHIKSQQINCNIRFPFKHTILIYCQHYANVQIYFDLLQQKDFQLEIQFLITR